MALFVPLLVSPTGLLLVLPLLLPLSVRDVLFLLVDVPVILWDTVYRGRDVAFIYNFPRPVVCLYKYNECSKVCHSRNPESFRD
jgi:hypothetical protein